MMEKKTPHSQSKSRLESAKVQGSKEKPVKPDGTRTSVLRSSKEEIKEFIELEKQAKESKLSATQLKPQPDFLKGALQKKPSEGRIPVYDYGREALKSRMQFGAVLKWEKKFSNLVSKDSSVCGNGQQASFTANATTNPTNSVYNTNTSLHSSASKPRPPRDSAGQSSAAKKHVPNKSHGVQALEHCKTQPESRAQPSSAAQETTKTQTNIPTPRARESFKSSVEAERVVDLGLLEEYKTQLEEVCVRQIDMVAAADQVNQRVQLLQAALEAQKAAVVDKIERELLHTLGIFEDLLPKNLVRSPQPEKPGRALLAAQDNEAPR